MKNARKFLHISVPPEFHKALRVRAARLGVTMSDLVKLVLAEHLKKSK